MAIVTPLGKTNIFVHVSCPALWLQNIEILVQNKQKIINHSVKSKHSGSNQPTAVFCNTLNYLHYGYSCFYILAACSYCLRWHFFGSSGGAAGKVSLFAGCLLRVPGCLEPGRDMCIGHKHSPSTHTIVPFLKWHLGQYSPQPHHVQPCPQHNLVKLSPSLKTCKYPMHTPSSVTEIMSLATAATDACTGLEYVKVLVSVRGESWRGWVEHVPWVTL